MSVTNCKCSTFAEYTAVSEAVSEILFLRDLLNESFDLNINVPMKVYEDNSGAISIARFGSFNNNSKHIELQFYFVNESYEKRIIDVVKIESELNLADLLTKSLESKTFLKNRYAVKLF